MYLLNYTVFETREAAFNAALADIEERMRDVQREQAKLEARRQQLADARQPQTDE